MKYAETTSVSVERSVAEIASILAKYGATQFGYMTDSARGLASIQFAAQNRHIRFLLKLPSIDDKEIVLVKFRNRNRTRTPEERTKAWEQACRQRWRALTLCIKAKLEAVSCGISEFETEFLAHIVLPGGKTVSEFIRPQIEQAYATGLMPPGISGMLPAPEESEDDRRAVR